MAYPVLLLANTAPDGQRGRTDLSPDGFIYMPLVFLSVCVLWGPVEAFSSWLPFYSPSFLLFQLLLCLPSFERIAKFIKF